MQSLQRTPSPPGGTAVEVYAVLIISYEILASEPS